MNKVLINLNIFVTSNGWWRDEFDMKLVKQILEPKKFGTSDSQTSILGFGDIQKPEVERRPWG